MASFITNLGLAHIKIGCWCKDGGILDLAPQSGQNFSVAMDFRSKVRETIFQYKMFSSGEKVLVAVSGGPDSVALLHLLHGLREEMDLRLEVAHLQHGIRGEGI